MNEKLFNLSNKLGEVKGYSNVDNGIYLAEWQGSSVKIYTKVGKMYFEPDKTKENPTACFVKFKDGEGEIFEIKEKKKMI